MLELLQLSGLQRRTAIQFIEGLELEPCEEGARIKFLTVVPFFQVTTDLTDPKTYKQLTGQKVLFMSPVSLGSISNPSHWLKHIEEKDSVWP